MQSGREVGHGRQDGVGWAVHCCWMPKSWWWQWWPVGALSPQNWMGKGPLDLRFRLPTSLGWGLPVEL